MNGQIKNIRTFVLQKMQLFISVLFLTLLFVACHTTSDKKQTNLPQVNSESIPASVTPKDTIDAIVNSIIEISANDFYKNQQPLPDAFRNVQIKYSIKPNKEILYILCGEFTTKDEQTKGEWTHFTTIKNSDYEQWIGPNGLTYCENSKEIIYSKTDLSVELLNRLNFIQKTKK
jgi:hypothetical protein